MTFIPRKPNHRYHDRRESWRLSNRKWAAANLEKKRASQAAYVSTPHGHFVRYLGNRDRQLRQMHARYIQQLAALEREEKEWHRTLLESATRMRSNDSEPSTST